MTTITCLRSEEEIQRVHDMLIALITEEIQPKGGRIHPDDDFIMRAQCDVLCWVLQHDHNLSFEGNINKLRSVIAASGYFETQS